MNKYQLNLSKDCFKKVFNTNTESIGNTLPLENVGSFWGRFKTVHEFF
jgi:hypothetical protein